MIYQGTQMLALSDWYYPLYTLKAHFRGANFIVNYTYYMGSFNSLKQIFYLALDNV